MAYNGPGSCIQSANTCEDESVTSKRDECHTDEDSSSCSSNNVSGSLSFHSKMDDQEPDEWEHSANPRQCVAKEKPSSHVDIMKEIFAKLLLGEDPTGGSKGHSSALALSNSITKLAASVFGELRKLEPLPDEKKNRWRREMEWLLSPTNYMVELVPAKQYDANGRTLEACTLSLLKLIQIFYIMRPKARVDVHMNLPALLKLDSMLIVGGLFNCINIISHCLWKYLIFTCLLIDGSNWVVVSYKRKRGPMGSKSPKVYSGTYNQLNRFISKKIHCFCNNIFFASIFNAWFCCIKARLRTVYGSTRPILKQFEMLDAMVNTEFWYEEVSQVEGKGESVKEGRRWRPLMPHVPVGGLSGEERKKLLNQAKIVHQIFMATKSINETILLEMPIPKIIGEALPKVTCYQHLPSLMYSLRVLSQMSSNKKNWQEGDHNKHVKWIDIPW
ncbi:putative PRONE domain, Rop guanine nucleotide exchange factor [Helianthus annuus]|nr:putative PRONE domain, Rop guanine nucleotide exchange factor [Helianthus annuus]